MHPLGYARRQTAASPEWLVCVGTLETCIKRIGICRFSSRPAKHLHPGQRRAAHQVNVVIPRLFRSRDGSGTKYIEMRQRIRGARVFDGGLRRWDCRRPVKLFVDRLLCGRRFRLSQHWAFHCRPVQLGFGRHRTSLDEPAFPAFDLSPRPPTRGTRSGAALAIDSPGGRGKKTASRQEKIGCSHVGSV